MDRSGHRRRNRAGAVLPLVALAVPTLGVAPAHALAPTVAAFLPTSGAAGSSVTITGLGFNDASPATSVRFNGTAATFTVDSALQITATVPAGATTGAISVTDAEGTGSSLVPFTVTSAAAPVVALFLPLTGPVGTAVTITGTGFTGATSVKFNGVAATYAVGSATQITATVPATATTGPISVTTPGGTGTSPVAFTVTPGLISTRHDRSISLSLGGGRSVKGRLSSTDGFTACHSGATVKIQRRGRHGWKSVGSVLTTVTGRFSKSIAHRGTYRALARRVALNGGVDICARIVSPPRHLG